ncbi:hypothetical protein [Streptomyces sp. NPDC057557]|uniref:hypothetical protein n=1 Tax=Streptomyces sp. NPDC057557 TaxID=3346167 RepID=UPI00368D3ED4
MDSPTAHCHRQPASGCVVAVSFDGGEPVLEAVLRIRNEGATRWIPAHNRFDHTRGDGAKIYKGAALPGGVNAEYAREGDHWDITFV